MLLFIYCIVCSSSISSLLAYLFYVMPRAFLHLAYLNILMLLHRHSAEAFAAQVVQACLQVYRNNRHSLLYLVSLLPVLCDTFKLLHNRVYYI